jgi:hypothetical protein
MPFVIVLRISGGKLIQSTKPHAASRKESDEVRQPQGDV